MCILDFHPLKMPGILWRQLKMYDMWIQSSPRVRLWTTSRTQLQATTTNHEGLDICFFTTPRLPNPEPTFLQSHVSGETHTPFNQKEYCGACNNRRSSRLHTRGPPPPPPPPPPRTQMPSHTKLPAIAVHAINYGRSGIFQPGTLPPPYTGTNEVSGTSLFYIMGGRERVVRGRANRVWGDLVRFW